MSSDRGSIFGGAQFFIRGRRVTRPTLREFIIAWLDGHRVKDAIDCVSADLGEEFYIALSTAYWWLALIRQWCLVNFAVLGLNPNRLCCLAELKFVDADALLKVFELLIIDELG